MLIHSDIIKFFDATVGPTYSHFRDILYLAEAEMKPWIFRGKIALHLEVAQEQKSIQKEV